MSPDASSRTPPSEVQPLQFPLHLYNALRVMRLHAGESPEVNREIEQALACLHSAFDRETAAIDLCLAGSRILIGGHPLPAREQERPQIRSLAGLLARLEVRELTFTSRIDARTLRRFLQILGDISTRTRPAGLLARELASAGIGSVKVREAGTPSPGKDEQPPVAEKSGGAAAGGIFLDLEKIREALRQILQGRFQVLSEPGVAASIPGAIVRLLENHKEEAADNLLVRIVTALRETSDELQAATAGCIAETAHQLAAAGQWQRLERLLPALEQTMRICGNDSLRAIKAVTAIEQQARHFMERRDYKQASDSLVPLVNLATDEEPDHQSLRLQACFGLDRLASLPLMEDILDDYLHVEELREDAGRLLTELGRKSAEFLLYRLSKSESRSQRTELLHLIGEIGKPAKDALLEHLQQPAPWYVVRNLIRLLGEVGDPDCFDAIAAFLEHKDLRVQQEVITTLGKIGGPERKPFFLGALDSLHPRLQPIVVRQLGQIPDDSLVMPLVDLFEESRHREQPGLEDLQVEICRALARIGSKKALPLLKKIARSGQVAGIEDYGLEVRRAADSAIRQIQEGQMRDQHRRAAGPSSPARKNDPIANREANIFRMAAQGKTEEAKQALFDLVVSCARNRDFATAERLRERIYEIDPMALTEIIRSGEIIEQEKTGAISRDQLQTWARLLDRLTPEEFSAIYHELERRTYQPEEVIVNQGDRNDELFFIDHGSVKVSYTRGDREIFVTSLNAGEIAGENFFSPSFWTISLTALTPTRISVLKQGSFARWHNEYPGLESKLRDFYDRCNNIQVLLEKKGLDRRRYERYQLSRKIQVQMVDTSGKPIGRGFRGELADISRGGLSFLIRISKKENTRLLLGRTMRVTIPVAAEPDHIEVNGIAIGVAPFHLLESDFSVHIKFNQPLAQDTLQTILG